MRYVKNWRSQAREIIASDRFEVHPMEMNLALFTGNLVPSLNAFKEENNI